MQNLILSTGTSKIGSREYDVSIPNAAPQTIEDLNRIPIKTIGSTTIYIKDVAWVRDGFPPQTNIVRVNGQRSVLLPIQKAGNASTLNVIAGIKALLPHIKTSLPPRLQIGLLGDQSIFVRGAISGVVRETLIAACLTAFMILTFLGSWRSTLIIATSIPLAILTSILALSALGETINIDVQVVGNDLEGNRCYANALLEKMRNVSGTADLRIQQPFDEPYLRYRVERTKAEQLGFSAHDIAQNLLVSLSGSFQTSPTYWLDPKNHVSYQIATQTPQYRADTLQDLANIPVTGTNPAAPPSILASLVSMQRGAGMGVVSHYNVAPVVDITGIQSRIKARAVLAAETAQAAHVAVSVVSPKKTVPAQEIILPGNVQPFIGSPIYARTNGYLRKWYFDIGAHVKAGELLALIETPEVDQQLQ